MDRLDLDEQGVQDARESALSAIAEMTGTWEPEDSPQREGDICPGTPLKLYDDVSCVDGNSYRVICAAEGRDKFTAWGIGPFGPMTISQSVYDVLDRAPADPQETPMPIVTAQRRR